MTDADAPTIDLSGFPKSDDEAAAAYHRWQRTDPFPRVKPALLNTADLLDYISTTGMIYPFELGPDVTKRLKPASCAVSIGGSFVYWSYAGRDAEGEEKSQEHTGTLVMAGDQVILPRNSITYVQLRPRFRLPNYIAARYNLKIRDVYRGLLVGTGPLVDPGFDGRLSVPIHNLTSRPHKLSFDDELVWMEFTKLSPYWLWDRSERLNQNRKGRYVPFPRRKLDRREIRDYIREAGGGPIMSSIPELIQTSADSARAAEAVATAIRDRVFRLSTIALLTGLAAAAGLVIAVATLFSSVSSQVTAAQQQTTTVRVALVAVDRELAADRLRLAEDSRRIRALEQHRKQNQRR